jgi:hypothetical protein
VIRIASESTVQLELRPLIAFRDYLGDDTGALKRAIARTEGPVILVGHAYAGAVIGAVNDERVKHWSILPRLPKRGCGCRKECGS